ncbi:hypothetical protein CPT_Magnus_034 [Klebsiella phage Magnus]|uniref:Uncharacterized protein n=1 Tax=Klebsiella phage Magnus TaxID=2589660 RepID=A0A5B9NAR7_9CAUD|nr:hypothetical protein HYP92_gp207 [Klebsiella phage Magnus]QEG07913.1 hypothetical protein CPT_Magnus_034 [Klebsiella phage Magnus]
MPCRLRCLHIPDTGGHQEELSSRRAIRVSYPARRGLGGRTKGKPETGVVFSSSQNEEHLKSSILFQAIRGVV